MCKFEDIIKTTPKKIIVEEKQKKGISMNRIEFNTNIVFGLAKILELPLDKTLSLIRDKNNSLLASAYRKRNEMKEQDIIKKLHRSILTQ